MRRNPLLSPALSASLGLLTTLVAPRAHALRGGTAVDGCNGCHTTGAEPGVTVDFTPRNPAAGESVTLRVTINAVNGSVGGFYLMADRGRLAAIDGQGTRLVDEHKIVHSAPKRAEGGAVRFDVRWTAPETPGGVVLRAWGVSANGDNSARGDGASVVDFSFAYGCTGATYYIDRDGDGYGTSSETRADCAQPPGFAAQGGDCDDFNPSIHPGHAEICNGFDDDCDGEVDEDLTITTHYEDADGDGYGGFSGATVMAKCPPAGFAPNSNDCNDRNPRVYPGATETCNQIDDNCDGRIDEGVREVCGVGLCARQATSCAPGSCTPGEPSEEVCNGFDDDCDGEVDEGLDGCEASEPCSGADCSTGAGGSTGSQPLDPQNPDPQDPGGQNPDPHDPGGQNPGTGPQTPGSTSSSTSDEGSAGGGCAVDPRGASPWRLLPLLLPLALAPLRRLRSGRGRSR